MPQTTIQKTAAIRKGSVRVKIGDSFSSLVDIGALRKPVLTSLVENQVITFDNVEDLKKFVNGKKVQFAFDLCEINLTNISKLDAGLVTLTTVAASPVSVVNEAITVAADTAVRLANKNGDNSRVTISAVNVAGAGASKTEGTDYEVFVDSNGYTNIVKIGTGSQDWEVDYSYTPVASKKLTFAESGNKTLKVMRVENIDENGLTFKIDIQNVTNLKAPVITFKGDDEADVAELPVEMQGDIVEIVDEQQTT